MMKKSLFFKIGMCLLLSAITVNGFSQQNKLQSKLQSIADSHPAIIGFSVVDLQNGQTFSINGTKHLPMQSVYKFHLALAILNQADQGKFSLEQKFLIKKSDLSADTWSPIRDKYPDGNVELSLSELLTYTIGLSDNNGCDILFNLMGGTAKVNAYIHKLGIEDVSIAATEYEMHHNELAQYTNWTTPVAACQLLELFYKKNILSQKSHGFLWKVMTETNSGANKIKGQLPAGTPVTHKTGYSGVNEKGITAATNDIGIVTLPNGKHFAVAAFVTMTKEEEKINEAIIAELTKATWDYFVGAN